MKADIPSGLKKPKKPPRGFKSAGIVFSGGGSRAAYQVGAMRALHDYGVIDTEDIATVVGTSIGSINGLILSAYLRHSLDDSLSVLESMWLERTFANTFEGTKLGTFMKAISVGLFRYGSPGPHATSQAIFNPKPFELRIDEAILEAGGLDFTTGVGSLKAVGVMTTMEGKCRKPLLFVGSQYGVEDFDTDDATFRTMRVKTLRAAHGLASAALPSILPPVDLNIETGGVRLVDGGICDNVPVDPALRLGAESTITIDCSGRRWWFDRYGEPHHTRPTWEVPAPEGTYCKFSADSFYSRNIDGFGGLLKEAVGRSSRDFIEAVGVIWPIYKILKYRLGEALAYEVMTYVAIHPEFAAAVMQRGYDETSALLDAQGYGDESTIASGSEDLDGEVVGLNA